MAIEPPDSFSLRQAHRTTSITSLTTKPVTSASVLNTPNSVNSTTIKTTNLSTNTLATVLNTAQATQKQIATLRRVFPSLTNPLQGLNSETKVRNETKNNFSSKMYLAEISIEGKHKIAVSQLPLKTGDQISLATVRSHENSHIFFYKEARSQEKSLPPSVYESIRQSLPKQSPITNIVKLATQALQDKNFQHFAQAIQLNENNKQISSNVSQPTTNHLKTPNLLELLTKVSQLTVDKSSITPEKIKALIVNNGTLLENLLHNLNLKNINQHGVEKTIIENDIKALLLIIKSIFENKTLYNAANKNQKADITQRLYQQTISSLAKIQLNQARSISENFSKLHDDVSHSNHLFFELPMRWDQAILPLSINIWSAYEKQAENDKEKSKNKKEPTWNVKLEFNLPNQEALYADIKSRKVESGQESISINLWITNKEYQSILLQASKKISWHLSNHGIEVDDIQVAIGEPHTKDKPFNLSLIDIQT